MKDGYNFIVYILDFKEGIEEIDVDEDMFLLVNEKVEFEKFEKDGIFKYFLYCLKNYFMVLVFGLMLFFLIMFFYIW